MAEIISNKGRSSAPRIDFTPMVDLGFLLITFFVMTSRLNEPNSLDIQMPIDSDDHTEIADFTAMTIYLGAHHSLYYYTGTDAMNLDFQKLKQTSFGKDGIRNALLDHALNVKRAIASKLKGSKPDDHPFILIKASKDCHYSDLIDVLDELAITNIPDYAILDMESNEEEFIHLKG